MEDKRNVTDHYKGMPIEDIIRDLDDHDIGPEIAIENLERDFNMGTIVRSANAFGVRHLHIIGSKQWNKRGAMMTDKYLHVHYHATVGEFIEAVAGKPVIAVDNVNSSTPLTSTQLPEDAVLVFGSEGNGLSDELMSEASSIIAIEQFGSTRSLNVGVAAGIVMYEWVRRNVIEH